MNTEETTKLAWRVEADGMICVTFAPTAKAARWNAISGGREAGYFLNYFPSVKAARAPEYDRNRLRKEPERRCWSEDYVRDCLNE